MHTFMIKFYLKKKKIGLSRALTASVIINEVLSYDYKLDIERDFI